MRIEQKLGADTKASAIAPGAWLAPLSGITDHVFRRIACRYGAALVVSEMVASGDYLNGSEEARLRAEGAGIDPHVVQLAGRDPEVMARAARLAESAGAAILDINMGCPAKRVTGGLAGSGLMRELDLAERIVARVAEAIAIPVTVKMRLGWDRDSLCAPELASRAVQAGAVAITVHGRTRQQFYTGTADWAAIRSVVAAVPVPVIANGDIVSTATAREALARSGAAGVMIGRAALGRPWLVGAIAGELGGRPVRIPAAPEKARIAVEHYDGLLSLYGVRLGVRHARKHLAAYAEDAARGGSGLSAADRLRLVTADEPRIVVDLLRRAFDGDMRAAA